MRVYIYITYITWKFLSIKLILLVSLHGWTFRCTIQAWLHWLVGHGSLRAIQHILQYSILWRVRLLHIQQYVLWRLSLQYILRYSSLWRVHWQHLHNILLNDSYLYNIYTIFWHYDIYTLLSARFSPSAKYSLNKTYILLSGR